jgi:hypothetical protein
VVMYNCASDNDIASESMHFLLNFETVPIVLIFLFFILYLLINKYILKKTS